MADSSSSSSSSSGASDAPRSFESRRLGCAGAAISVAVILLGFVFVLPYSRVTGRELNPDTLEVRHFSYYRIPFTQIGVSPIRRTTLEPGWGAFLIDEGYWKLAQPTTGTAVSLERRSRKNGPAKSGGAQRGSQSPPAQRWHLVGVDGVAADAAVFVEIMETRLGNGDNQWVAWTKDHPQTARVLWSHVATAADLELYPYIVIMLRTAIQFPELPQFKKHMRLRLREFLTRDLKTARERGDADRAVRVARLGASLWPDEQLWRKVAPAPNSGSSETSR